VPPRPPASRPLADQDWNALGELLDRPGGPRLDTVLGLLTAVLSAPSPIPPDTWLPLALGDRHATPAADPLRRLLLRLHDHLQNDLYDQLVHLPDPDQPSATQTWCNGYMTGVDLDPTWADDDQAMAPIFPIAVLARRTPLNAPDDPPDTHIPDTEAWEAHARQSLPDLILTAHERTHPDVAPQTPLRRDHPKVGRNDPCPCGSGKKHKACCARP
jgi:uncharacterized protein